MTGSSKAKGHWKPSSAAKLDTASSCRRPVSTSSDALNIGRQWRDMALANDEDAAASSPPFEQQGSRAPHVSKSLEGLHHQDSPGTDAAIFAPPIPPQAAVGCSAEPDWPQQQHAGYSHRLGMQSADAAPGAPSELPQNLRGIAAEPAAPEQHFAGSNSKPDQAPEGAEQVAPSGQGPFLGSAGIVMSSWGESQVMALPSLGQIEQNGQEGHHGQQDNHHVQEESHPVNHHGQGEHQRGAEVGLHYGHDDNHNSAAAGLQHGQEECQLGAEAGLQHRLDEHQNSGGAGSPSQPAPEALVILPN